jgi:hypothetical protein
MQAKAIIDGWPIDDKIRNGIIGALISIIADPNTKPREKISACKAIMIAEAQNKANEQHGQRTLDTTGNRLFSIVANIDATESSGNADEGAGSSVDSSCE